MDAAIKHCTAGIGIWEWASNDRGSEPDVVMACCGDSPTNETLATVDILRRHAPDPKVRVVNVVNLMKLQPRPADLPASRSRKPARSRIQGRGNDDDAVRHARVERFGPLPPFRGRGKPCAQAWGACRLCQTGGPGQADRTHTLHQGVLDLHALNPQLVVERGQSVEGGPSVEAGSAPGRGTSRGERAERSA